jgi:hypothetical protein
MWLCSILHPVREDVGLLVVEEVDRDPLLPRKHPATPMRLNVQQTHFFVSVNRNEIMFALYTAEMRISI